MSKEYPVKGLAQLDNYLSAFPSRLQRGAYSAALTAAGAVIRDEARARVGKRTGLLSRSIQTGSARRLSNGAFAISVGPRGKAHSFLGLFQEYGVRPHYLNVGTSELKVRKLNKAARDGGHSDVETRALVIDGKFVTGLILHPGHMARPFLRPALDAGTKKALEAFAERIRAYIETKTGFTAPILEDAA